LIFGVIRTTHPRSSIYLGSGAHEEQFEKLADQFLLGDPEIINSPFFSKTLPA
jgi:hypothetical protein